jgi:hypothetical protein
MEGLTAQDIRKALATRFADPEWALFFEVPRIDSVQRRERRIDVVAMNLWYSRGYAVHGGEIKVSRRDWLMELRDPAKAQAGFVYCNAWWLMSAPGVANLEEIPETWGWLEFSGTRWSTKKKAPPLIPKPLDQAFVASLVARIRQESSDLYNDGLAKGRQEEAKRFQVTVDEARKAEQEANEVRYRLEEQLRTLDPQERAKRLDWPLRHAQSALERLTTELAAVEKHIEGLRAQPSAEENAA